MNYPFTEDNLTQCGKFFCYSCFFKVFCSSNENILFYARSFRCKSEHKHLSCRFYLVLNLNLIWLPSHQSSWLSFNYNRESLYTNCPWLIIRTIFSKPNIPESEMVTWWWSDRNYIIETHPLHDTGVDEGQCRVQNLLSECLRNFTPKTMIF